MRAESRHARLGDGWQTTVFDLGMDRLGTTEAIGILRLVHHGIEGGEGVIGQGALAGPHVAFLRMRRNYIDPPHCVLTLLSA